MMKAMNVWGRALIVGLLAVSLAAGGCRRRRDDRAAEAARVAELARANADLAFAYSGGDWTGAPSALASGAYGRKALVVGVDGAPVTAASPTTAIARPGDGVGLVVVLREVRDKTPYYRYRPRGVGYGGTITATAILHPERQIVARWERWFPPAKTIMGHVEVVGPSYPEAWPIALATKLHQGGDPVDTGEHGGLEVAERRSDELIAEVGAVLARVNDGEGRAALTELRALVKRSEAQGGRGQVEAVAALGYALLRVREDAEADKTLVKAAELAERDGPRSADLHQSLLAVRGLFLISRGRLAEARVPLERARGVASTRPDGKHKAPYALASLALGIVTPQPAAARALVKEGIEALERADDLEPEIAATLDDVAAALEVTGHRAEAGQVRARVGTLRAKPSEGGAADDEQAAAPRAKPRRKRGGTAP